MGAHPQREEAIRRCLDQAEPPVQVAADLGVATSTLRGSVRQARLKKELAELQQQLEAQNQRQEQLVAELQQAAVALAELKRILDRGAGRAAD